MAVFKMIILSELLNSSMLSMLSMLNVQVKRLTFCEAFSSISCHVFLSQRQLSQLRMYPIFFIFSVL
jgi:hypothetical protein